MQNNTNMMMMAASESNLTVQPANSTEVLLKETELQHLKASKVLLEDQLSTANMKIKTLTQVIIIFTNSKNIIFLPSIKLTWDIKMLLFLNIFKTFKVFNIL